MFRIIKGSNGAVKETKVHLNITFQKKSFNLKYNKSFRGAKFSFFLMLIFVIPLCVETEIILKWWLNIVPQYAIPFVQWTLITSLVTILTSTMITGLHATVKIKKYMIIVGGIECMNFPITYVFFKIGYMPMSAYYIYFITNVILIFLRIYLVKDLLYFNLNYIYICVRIL